MDANQRLAVNRRLNRIELVIGVLWLVQAVIMSARPGFESWQPQVPLAALVIVVHAVLELAHRRRWRVAHHSHWSLPFVDVVLCGLGLWQSVRYLMPDHEEANVAALMLLAGFAMVVLLSLLSLHRGTVVATTALAIGIELIVFAEAKSLTWATAWITVLVLGGCGAVAGYVAHLLGGRSGDAPAVATEPSASLPDEDSLAFADTAASGDDSMEALLREVARVPGAGQPAPGEMLTPSLRLEAPLGRGGMGQVWRAHHLGLDCAVAVKLIGSDVVAHPRAAERFAREARLAAKIKSPHVVEVHDAGVTEAGQPYLVMELLEGESLAKRLHDRGRLPVDEVAAIVAQLCDALSAAHARDIVHRDIKPDNIFLSSSATTPVVKVFDFGIAKQRHDEADAMTKTGAMLGTPLYMSPEQVRSPKGLDARADLWAAAVTAYQALTGRLPFVGDTVGAISIAIASSDFRPVSDHDAALTSFDAWFGRAFQRDAEARFESAAALAEAFAVAASQAPMRDQNASHASA